MIWRVSPDDVQRCLGRRPFLLALVAGLGIGMADVFPSSGWHTVLAVGAGLVWMRARGWVVWLLPTLLVFHAWHEHGLSLSQGNPVRLRLLELPERKVFGSVRGVLLPLEEASPSARQRVSCELKEISWGGDGAYEPAKGRVVALLPRGCIRATRALRADGAAFPARTAQQSWGDGSAGVSASSWVHGRVGRDPNAAACFTEWVVAVCPAASV